MTSQPKKNDFSVSEISGLTMPEALARAKESLAQINPAPLDAVRSCTRDEDGRWRATLDVIESPARMGDNDLLSAYELTIGQAGDLLDFRRTERFYREDRVNG